jgi:preprotein translocase subunit YajC
MATPTATATPTARSASGMSTGAKIGAGVGAGVVGVLLVLLLVFFVLRCRRAQRVGAAPTEQPLEGLRHGKEINLTGKQVLGIDDDSYMRELPITECTLNHVADVALRCLANNTTSSE